MKKTITISILIISTTFVFAQVNLGKGFNKDKAAQAAWFRAEELYEGGNFLLALPYFRSLEPKYGSTPLLRFRIGECLLYKGDEASAALEYLLEIKKTNPKAVDIDLLIARAYHLNERYDEALNSLELYKKAKSPTPKGKDYAQRLEVWCNNAKIISDSPVDATVTNFGEPVNTENSEYVPVLTSDDSVLIFTYLGEKSIGGLQTFYGVPDSTGFYFEDVYVAYKKGEGWTEPKAFGNRINSNGHDANITISHDGLTMLVYKHDLGGGDIYMSRWESGQWSVPMPIAGDVNTNSWEGSATFSSDLRQIYFVSERSGGFGGRDLYVAYLQPDGSYANVKNLGPTINTEWNEDAPYMHPNDQTMVFSSEGHNSMGGYDIFKTEVDPATGQFSVPENVGYPINSPDNDKYLVLGNDGKHGYYSSAKAGGYGQQDLYVVHNDFKIKTFVMLVKGNIYLDDKPVKATVTVIDESGKRANHVTESNNENGYYLFNLAQESKYKLVYEIDGMEKQEQIVDAKSVTQLPSKTINIRFYTSSFARKDTIKTDSIPVVPVKTEPIINPPIVGNSDDFNSILATYGNATAEGMWFRVQVAAYNFPQNYRYNHLTTLGKIDRVVLDDNITRFTMGKFRTLAEADAYRKQIVAAGQTDAFVTSERNGKRYLLKELAALKFFQY
jgi:hypothetical protein